MLQSLYQASAAENENMMMKNSVEIAEKDSLNSGRLTSFCCILGRREWIVEEPQEQVSTRRLPSMWGAC